MNRITFDKFDSNYVILVFFDNQLYNLNYFDIEAVISRPHS